LAADGHVREQRVVLEHHADVALVRRHADDLAVAEQDAAGVGPGEAGQHHQQRRLAGPGRSEQRQELAALDVEADVVERG
jgi:hypothetical protein